MDISVGFMATVQSGHIQKEDHRSHDHVNGENFLNSIKKGKKCMTLKSTEVQLLYGLIATVAATWNGSLLYKHK